MANIATSTQGPLGTSSEKRKRDETTAKDDPGVDNIKRSAKAKDASADNTPEDHTFLFEGEIDAEPAKVFAVITDLSLAPKIDPSIVSVTPLKGATKGGNAKGDDEDDAKAADVTSKSRERQGWLAFLPGLFRKRELPNPVRTCFLLRERKVCIITSAHPPVAAGGLGVRGWVSLEGGPQDVLHLSGVR
eukprot:scaffold1315_cov405-Prasinococcus_capsulatus_cf.AAC.11